MRETLRPLIDDVLRVARVLDKSMPTALTGGQWTGTGFIDAYRRNRNPTPNELLAELKGAAWSCVSIDAAVCANYPPRLYVATGRGQARPKCLTRALTPQDERRFARAPHLDRCTKAADVLEEAGPTHYRLPSFRQDSTSVVDGPLVPAESIGVK